VVRGVIRRVTRGRLVMKEERQRVLTTITGERSEERQCRWQAAEAGAIRQRAAIQQKSPMNQCPAGNQVSLCVKKVEAECATWW